MHYYQRNLGDYAAAAGHLTALEHGIYTLLLDWYYSNESPIPADRAHRIARANPEETKSVLQDFFQKDGQVWRHRRCDAEIEAYKAKKERAAENGRRGGRPPKSLKDNETETQPFTDPNLDQTQVKTNQEPRTNKEQEQRPPSGAGAPDCPHLQIIEAYNRILPELPGVRSSLWNGTRAKHLASRWKEDSDRQRLEWWEEFFGFVRTCPLLMGQVGATGWKADLGWLVNPTNIVKVIEGKYCP